MNPAPARWGPVSQAFHWASALLLVAIGGIGLYMEGLPNAPDKIRIYALHKSLGLTLLAIVLLRLAWRWTRPGPAPVPGLPGWTRRAASGVHWGLYTLMLAVPVAGWAMNSAAGYPLQWFGLLNLPAIAPRDEALAGLAGNAHELGFWVLVLLVVGHVFAALYHHLFLHDGTLSRMLPGPRRRPSEPPT
jgi:cytochrome b561